MMNRREALQLLSTALLTTNNRVLPVANTTQTSLLTKPVPSTGELLPVIGLGTYQTFDVGTDAGPRVTLRDVLRTFTELGGTVVDSSPMYGRSERVVGDIISAEQLRSRLFVATKVWANGRQSGIKQMNESLKYLRVKQIDLMQVHNLLDVDVHLATLAEWKREGLIRLIGITHYTASSLNDVARVMERQKVDLVQINYSIGERDAERRLLPMAQERGVAVIANRPFAAGALFRTLQSKPLPSWSSEIACTSWAQIMLKFVVSHPSVTCAIPATSNVAHLHDNMAAGRGPMPDAALRARIATIIS